MEDYHSDNVKMDKDFYKRIHGIVYRKIKNVCLLHKYVAEYQGKCESKSEFDKLMQTVPEILQLKFIRYLQELVWGFNYGMQWDKAKIVASISEKQSLASYVLSGKFSECCRNGNCLDNKTMCEINKDIHNRIYTLLVQRRFIGIFMCPKKR